MSSSELAKFTASIDAACEDLHIWDTTGGHFTEHLEWMRDLAGRAGDLLIRIPVAIPHG